jgi:uncharacterized membrane protein
MTRPLLPMLSWRAIFGGLLGAVVVHIAYTLILPSSASERPFDRLVQGRVANNVYHLPPIEPGRQPVAFMTPNLRFAICPFDIARGSRLAIAVELTATGSFLSLLAPDGTVFYALAAKPGRPIKLEISLLPPVDRGFFSWLQGPTPVTDPSRIRAPTSRGLLAVGVPVAGAAFAEVADAMLANVSCRLSVD